MSMRKLWATGVGFCTTLALLGCSSEDPTTPKPNNNGNGGNGGSGVGGSGVGGSGVGGSGVGGSGVGGSGVGGSGVGGSGVGGSGVGGSGVGGAGGDAGSGGSTGGSGGSGVGGSGVGGTGAGGAGGYPHCEGRAKGPCGSFTSARGTTTTMGPLGASMDYNLGQGHEVAIHPSDNLASCTNFGNIFGEDPALTARLMDLAGGCDGCPAVNLALHTVFFPSNMQAGQKYPVITWGNGTCAQPEGYGSLLRYVASHGYVVVAANSRYVGQGASNGAMLKALDYILAANNDSASPFYQKLDTTNVGAMGHSQGSGATVAAARDPRIKAVILFNGGTSASKPFLAISADMDLAGGIAGFRSAVQAAPKGAFIWYKHPAGTGGFRGHLTLMMEPDRVTGATVGWWNLLFRNDAAARDLFVGSSCGLCNKTADFEFAQKGL
jgi:hypothetical protein